MKGFIHSIETMGTLDGPGVRSVVFLQGCPMRCIYCHNPDTWKIDEGKEIDSSELLQKISRFIPYFGTDGGVTLSGGEPFMQPDFALEILRMCKEKGIHIAVDTCGYHMDNIVREALGHTDLVILDIKHAVQSKFMQLTGKEMLPLLRFLEYLRKSRVDVWIRQVIVPGWNDSEEDMRSLVKLIGRMPSLKKVELLPYHKMGIYKWHERGIPYMLEDTPEADHGKVECLQRFIDEMQDIEK